jgi:beta-xylosidase
MNRVLLPALMLAASATLATGAEPLRDFRPGEIWPDTAGVHINCHGGGILLHEGTYYWFGEHKVAGKAGNFAQVGVSVYSSKDLYSWRNEGIALPVSAAPDSEIAKGCILERPKVIHNPKTGKFVMWFHLEPAGRGYGAARSGVAVADKVTGPYEYRGSLRPNAGVWPANVPETMRHPLTPEETQALGKVKFVGGPTPDYPNDIIFRRDFAAGQMARDMSLFVDDDGKAYHLYSSEENGTLHVSQLTADYLRPAGNYVRLFPGGFHEAPAMFKHQGKYYLFTSGCTGWKPNAARVATASAIAGPWQELGNPCIGRADRTRITFESQSTAVLPVAGKPGAFIFMADRWRPANAIDGRHVWLPVQFDSAGRPFLEWRDRWELSAFR